MGNSRRDFFIKTGKGLAAIALESTLGGCAGVQRSFPNFHVSGYEIKDRTEAEEPYKLEPVSIFVKGFYVQRVSVTGEELPFMFLPFDETRTITDVDTGRTRLESNRNYVPQKVRVGDRFAEEVDLMMDLSPEGIRGVKADILSLEELRQRVGASRDSPGFSGVTTELDRRYRIGTIDILEVKYFFPHVRTSETGKQGMLDFNLIPVKGSEIIINPNGMITLRNPGKIYRPVLILGNEGYEISPSQVETIRKD